MGRGIASRHQRMVKAEKSKVKLKGKKELPKGTNVTKTAFKVKKIVIREQVKNLLNDEQPLSKTKLNIKELLSRLEHFNTTARVDALNGLKDLITAHGQLTLTNNLGQLLKGVAPLVLDKEKNVRREAYKVLHMILSPLPLDKIAPFFDALCSYLRCAMTHIDTRIHEDSLLYFDILLLCAPDLMGINVHKILPSFLDMISKLRVDSKPGRTLLVNLGSKMTSIKWRIKVLSRLHQLLQTLCNIRTNKNIQRNDMPTRRTDDPQVYDTNKLKSFPLYRGLILSKLSCFSKDKNIYSNNENEGERLKSYIQVLIPLLFETWLEVRPASNSDAKKVESVVSEEGVLILRYILQIFYLLWSLGKLVETEQRNCQITSWFIQRYSHDFSQYISNSFPYIQGALKKRKKEGPLINLDEKVTDEKCLEENLTVCHIFIIMNCNTNSNIHHIDREKVFSYLQWTIGHIFKRNPVCQDKFLVVLQCILKSDDWTKCNKMHDLLKVVVDLYWTGEMQPSFKQNLFSLLCSILLNDNLSHLQSTECFQSWLGELPNVICGAETISLESFNIISRLAIQNNKLFNLSIKDKLELFVKKFPYIKIIEIPDEDIARKKLVGLLFWIKPWTTEALNILHDQFSEGIYSGDVRNYLVDILKTRLNGIFDE